MLSSECCSTSIYYTQWIKIKLKKKKKKEEEEERKTIFNHFFLFFDKNFLKMRWYEFLQPQPQKNKK